MRYLISEPDEPTWWEKHKPTVYAVVGLAAGVWLASAGGHGNSAPAGTGTSPTPSITASPSGR
ncbi:hypothetical protein O1G21_41020 (plasmid) [Kitasatospora cathayae]|uniref:Uncharacterized protein n=1 Tax=Kitasatospora cathayae TaxID=3004092 RepID=A0ABY7QH96_9ACTN|nr:hypothetical protein [Kitasatospora sp. HUAS 3-15]WBP92220.1 hypothetical protein O1G21_41020 [Kitasatospora sp. HUAS 3-15]